MRDQECGRYPLADSAAPAATSSAGAGCGHPRESWSLAVLAAPALPAASWAQRTRTWLETSVDSRGLGHRDIGLIERFFTAKFAPRREGGLDDVLIASAATQVAIEAAPNLCVRRIRVIAQQLIDGDDHAGRTEAALQTVLLPERLLN